jgi:hypothetical protein
LAYEERRQEVVKNIGVIELAYARLSANKPERLRKLNRIFEIMRFNEIAFMEHVFRRVRPLIAGRDAHIKKFKESPDVPFAESVVLLWDVDSTIADGDREKMRSTIRPAFVPLMKLLKETFPHLKHGILTARDNQSISKQLIDPRASFSISSVGHLFDQEHVFSSKDFANIRLGKRQKLYVSGHEPERIGYEEKVRAYHGINVSFPRTYFILVDDVLQSHFEEIGAGIRVLPREQCTYLEALSQACSDE